MVRFRKCISTSKGVITRGRKQNNITSVTALIVGGLFQDAYKEQNLAPENLSRSLEDSVTILEPLMPWTVSAMFMATTLGVPTVDYMPWAVFCYSGGIFSLLIAATYKYTNFGLKKL